MRTRGVFAVGALILASLAVVSLAGASSPFKRYTFPAAPKRVIPAGTMTVLLPSEWRVYPGPWGISGGPGARDPVHTSVGWSIEAALEPSGTTLAQLRRTMLGWSGTTEWGKGTRMRQMVGDTYLRLPMGKVWRYTLALVPTKQTGPKLRKFGYWRIYVLDRGLVRTQGGTERELFMRVNVRCSPPECRTHNGQLAAIMRSIRFTA